ncbi:MAG: hypothetical protein COA96_10305 [SAR86 cluster bacterium]|uniref:Holin n=1 Tax=SAR86 cluster bacterium TaxID=2030880 RepID=A0A2A5AZA2_9GAMM|nr:MAG: hypothetical protein COA96_10305 [SAR86 cluster bacterium]
MSKTKIIVIVDDRLWKSIARDIGTLTMGVAFMSIGSVLDNNSMEVAGFIAWALFLLSKVSESKTKTVKEARAILDEMEEPKP